MKISTMLYPISLAIQVASASSMLKQQHKEIQSNKGDTDTITALHSAQFPVPDFTASPFPKKKKDIVNSQDRKQERSLTEGPDEQRVARVKREYVVCNIEELEQPGSVVFIGKSKHASLIGIEPGIDKHSFSCCVARARGNLPDQRISVPLPRKDNQGIGIGDIKGVSNIAKLSDDKILVAISTSSDKVYLAKLKVDLDSHKPKISLQGSIHKVLGYPQNSVSLVLGSGISGKEDVAIIGLDGKYISFNRCLTDNLSSCDSSKESWIKKESKGKVISIEDGSNLMAVYWPSAQSTNLRYIKAPFTDLDNGGELTSANLIEDGSIPITRNANVLLEDIKFAATRVGNNTVIAVAQPKPDKFSVGSKSQNITLSFLPMKLLGQEGSRPTTITMPLCGLESMHLVPSQDGSDAVAAIAGKSFQGKKAYYIVEFNPEGRKYKSGPATKAEYKAALAGIELAIHTTKDPTTDSSPSSSGVVVTTVGAEGTDAEHTKFTRSSFGATDLQDTEYTRKVDSQPSDNPNRNKGTQPEHVHNAWYITVLLVVGGLLLFGLIGGLLKKCYRRYSYRSAGIMNNSQEATAMHSVDNNKQVGNLKNLGHTFSTNSLILASPEVPSGDSRDDGDLASCKAECGYVSTSSSDDEQIYVAEQCPNSDGTEATKATEATGATDAKARVRVLNCSSKCRGDITPKETPRKDLVLSQNVSWESAATLSNQHHPCTRFTTIHNTAAVKSQSNVIGYWRADSVNNHTQGKYSLRTRANSGVGSSSSSD